MSFKGKTVIVTGNFQQIRAISNLLVQDRRPELARKQR
jgi:hypothetical protein